MRLKKIESEVTKVKNNGEKLGVAGAFAKVKIIYVIHAILTIILIFSVSYKASSSTILEKRYVFDKLDELWKTGVGATRPDETWFSDLVADNNGFQAVIDDPSRKNGNIFDDLPFDGVLVGEDSFSASTPSTPSRQQQKRGFPVISIPNGVAAKIYKRTALLEIYLSRYIDFAPTSTDTPVKMDALTRRLKSAVVESYLMNLLLYFAESTFEKKCSRIAKVKKFEDKGLSSWSEGELIQEWRPLWSIYQYAKAKFTKDIVRQLACNVRPTRSRGEVEGIVKDRVSSLLFQQVKKKVEETMILLQQKSAEFQSLVNQMNIEMKTTKLMELEQVLGDVQSNILMVKNDQLKAAELIEKLKKVDLTKLNVAGGVQELVDANAFGDEMAKKIALTLKGLGPVSKLVGEPSFPARLKVCDGLDVPYNNINFGQDTSTLRSKIIPPFESCVSEAQAIVTKYKKPSATKKLMGDFSKFVQQISSGILGDSGPN